MNKYTILCLAVFLICTASVSTVLGQDLYDRSHTEQFALFLFQTRQYDLAAREYERLYILEQDQEPRVEMFVSYRLAGLSDQGRTRIFDIYKDQPSRELFFELTKMQLISQRFDELVSSTKIQPNLNQQEKTLIAYLPSVYLTKKAAKKYQTDEILTLQFDEHKWQSLNNNLKDFHNQKWKNPWLAGGLSALVPGAGRIYAGDWKNAIFSFLFVGMNAYQSYRGFRDNGISSPSGWIYGSIGLGFYIGNIYGAVWSTNRINEKKRSQYQRSVEQLYFNF